MLRTPLPFALLAVLPHLVFAQSNPDRMQTGNGARALGMGHAATATVNDATALGWNPAGLSSIQRVEFSYVGAMRLIQPDPRFDGPTFAYSSVQVSNVTVPVTFASLAIPVNVGPIAVVGAVAYRALHDWAHTEEVRSYFESGEDVAALRERYSREGGVYAYSAGVGVSFWERLRLGATVNVMTGGTQNEATITRLGNGWTTPGTTTGSSEVRGYSGKSIDVGAIVHLGQKMRLGAKVGLPFERESEGVSGSGTVVRSRVEAPRTYAVGAMFITAPGRVWAIDVRHEPWSEGTVENLSTGAVAEAAPFDITSYHLGYERSEDFQGTRISTRAGLFYRPTAYGDFDDDQIIGYGGTIGRAWRWNRIGFDLSGSFVFYGEHVRSESSAGRFAVAEQEIQLLAGLQVFLR